MHQIIYESRASAPLSYIELVILLVKARDYNEQAQITGSLVYGQGRFMQVLEGEQAVVTALYERIRQDARHEQVVTLADRAVSERSFGKWSMAFRYLSSEQYQTLAGFVEPAHWPQVLLPTGTVELPVLERMRALIEAGGGRW